MLKPDRMRVNMFDLLMCLTNAGDLISQEIANHHQQVAYLAFRIGEQLKLPLEHCKSLMFAGLLHDIGAFSLDEKLALIETEPPSVHDHAHRGAHLIEGFTPLADVAEIIRYHHMPWANGAGRMCGDAEVTKLSHIIHLADRIAVSIDKNNSILDQVDGIRERILAGNGTLFAPEAVDAFTAISTNEYIWLDVVYWPLLQILPMIVTFDTLELELDEIIELTMIFANIVDFRSPFTANHSAGVAITAQKLAELAGFSEIECKMMFIAGNLHDLGKLAVSKSILEKQGSIDAEERNAIKSHTYYTYRLLRGIKGFDTINRWASFHHEKLNGQGYPFHLAGDSIPLGARIMAVADVFVAITEDRPYRKGMTLAEALALLGSMVEDNALSSYVVSLLRENAELVNAVRIEAQQQSSTKYNSIVVGKASQG